MLEIQESSFVVHSLPQLHLSPPCVRRISLLTVVALKVLNDELDLECLLKKRVHLHFFLNSQLDFYSPRVRLCPNKSRVEQFDSLEAFDVLEADGEQLCTFELAERPRWPLVPVAVTAMVQRQALRDAFRDVNLALQTVDTSICTVRLCHDTANAASNHGLLQNFLVNSRAIDFTAGAARVRFVAHIVIVDSVVKVVILLSINSWFEKNIVFSNLVLFHR